jgi:glyoxylase-like metal-dependent hydrolase (beta-lactamase superfamily II)
VIQVMAMFGARVWADTEGVHRLQVAMPGYQVTVNAYLVEGDPLTLVDSGPSRHESLIALEEGLAAVGVRIEDLERVVLTHNHNDHVGLASVIRERSGAEICAAAPLARWLPAHLQLQAANHHYAADLMRQHGVPEALVERSEPPGNLAVGWDPSHTVDRELEDGELLEGTQRSWRIAARPGHSPFDTVLYDERGGVLLSGDHLLKHTASNPLITVTSLNPVDERPRPLLRYRDSLRATRELPADLIVLPGHGELIDDHRALIDRRLDDMAGRSERVMDAIADGPLSAHAVAQLIWGERAEAQPWLTLCAVLGYADLLHDAGLVCEEPGPKSVLLRRTRGVIDNN